MASSFDAVSLNGISLRPAPFVSTAYEYNKSGQFTIGGFLIVTLTGTLIGKNLSQQITQLTQLQNNNNCINLIIGCSGGSDFLDGSGRIRSITVNPSDQPYLTSYSIQIAIESMNGEPAVKPDQDFLNQNCLSVATTSFLQEYSENISINGEGSVIGSNDSGLQVSKSYIKASGKITIKCYAREVCGRPDYNPQTNAMNIIESRARAFLGLNPCPNIINHPINRYNSWNKWLDSKSLTVSEDKSFYEWSFELYFSKGSGNFNPIAWVDVTTETKTDQKTNFSTSTISGNIKGLSAATTTALISKVSASERSTNARAALGALFSFVANGRWPGDSVALTGQTGDCPTINNSCNIIPSQCLQRISSSIKESVVDGEIAFTAEFGPISSCRISNDVTIDYSVEEKLPAARYKEYVVLNRPNSLVIDIGASTPHTATITVRGSTNFCDKTKRDRMAACVYNKLLEEKEKLMETGPWIVQSTNETIGTLSYAITEEFLKCG